MDLSTALTSFLLAFLLVEITAALVFIYKYAWSEGRVSVEAGVIELCDLL